MTTQTTVQTIRFMDLDDQKKMINIHAKAAMLQYVTDNPSDKIPDHAMTCARAAAEVRALQKFFLQKYGNKS